MKIEVEEEQNVDVYSKSKFASNKRIDLNDLLRRAEQTKRQNNITNLTVFFGVLLVLVIVIAVFSF